MNESHRAAGAGTVSATIPSATYRLQFNQDFTFRDAEAVVSYLHTLGISHVYASPILQALPGSTHGYDVCDPEGFNQALGSEQDFDALVAQLHTHGMGLLLDTVPNHMGISDSCNAWWQDVLENGPSSAYATYFDIEWQPVKTELAGKILLPILEDQYGRVLEAGKLRLVFEEGSISLCYYDTRLPLAPRTYAAILSHRLEYLIETLGAENEHVLELQSILTAINYLPSRTEQEPDRLAERSREKEIVKRRLVNLCKASREVEAAIEEAIDIFNGHEGDSHSFDLLDDLINRQVYRPAFWRVAGEEINYRRFFDINALAAVRVELPEVFHMTHDFTLKLLAAGKAQGLRIDHPDGLWDPATYFRRLQESYLQRLRQDQADEGATDESPERLAPGDPLPLYVVAEKILSESEPLPVGWAVHGTTGYDFLASVNALFVQSAHERAFDRIYSRFTGQAQRFEDLILDTQALIMRESLSSEINALGHQLERVAERNRKYRDFTLRGMITALRDITACLPVYRTYIDPHRGTVSARDRLFIQEAVGEAKHRNPSADFSTYDFIRDTLLLRTLDDFTGEDRTDLMNWVMKFQQLTGPVMAKGVEDTAFYRYNRLASLNEVGGDPRQFGISVPTFHRHNIERKRDWPHSMLATSTHDNKRSEDVRARINVLSELPQLWRDALGRWSRANNSFKTQVDGRLAPDPDNEYLIYQTILGTWPFAVEHTGTGRPDGGEMGSAQDAWRPLLPPSSNEEYTAFCKRIVQYIIKATREAKVYTSWINPNTDYEDAMQKFVERILTDSRANRFLRGLPPLLRRVAFYGQFNSLSQVLLKFTSPGLPDIYQGNELWDFSLVDPDNRRPIDYQRRSEILRHFVARTGETVDGGELPSLAAELVEHSYDGRIKLYITWQTLNLRRRYGALFSTGDYQPLEVVGLHKQHVVAFARTGAGRVALTVVPRLIVSLTGDQEQPPTGTEIWEDTFLRLPRELAEHSFRNIFTGETVQPENEGGSSRLPMPTVCAHFPVALLTADAVR